MDTAIKVHPFGCKQQKLDYDNLMLAADNVGAASLALATNGAQAYSQFIDARDSFKQLLEYTAKNYRYVETL